MKYSSLCVKLLLIIAPVIYAQEEEQAVEVPPQQGLSDEAYELASSSVVKLVSDSGRKIGSGVLVGIHKDGIGFVLTTYSQVAGRDKVAVILKHYTEPLLGHFVDRWIDLDRDLAIVGVKNFPQEQLPVTLADKESEPVIGAVQTVIGHGLNNHWLRVAAEVVNVDEQYFFLRLTEEIFSDGAIFVNDQGQMLGMVISEKIESEGNELTMAVKSSEIKPIIREWFQPIALSKKWDEQGKGLAPWIWAVGGGVLGGAAATIFAISGGADDGGGSRPGLPRPPPPEE